MCLFLFVAWIGDDGAGVVQRSTPPDTYAFDREIRKIRKANECMSQAIAKIVNSPRYSHSADARPYESLDREIPDLLSARSMMSIGSGLRSDTSVGSPMTAKNVMDYDEVLSCDEEFSGDEHLTDGGNMSPDEMIADIDISDADDTHSRGGISSGATPKVAPRTRFTTRSEMSDKSAISIKSDKSAKSATSAKSDRSEKSATSNKSGVSACISDMSSRFASRIRSAMGCQQSGKGEN